MLTAAEIRTDDRVRALEIGADAFLSRPIDPSELAAQIKAMARIKRAEDTLRKDKAALVRLNTRLTSEVAERTLTEAALKEHRVRLSRLLDARYSELMLLKRINDAVNHGLPFDAVLRVAVEGVRHFFGYLACEVFMLDETGESITLTALDADAGLIAEIESSVGARAMGWQSALDGGSLYAEVIRTGRTVVTSDVEVAMGDLFAEPAHREAAARAARAWGGVTFIRTALMVENEVFGIMGVVLDRGVEPHDVDALELLAMQVAILVQKARAEAGMREEHAMRVAIEESVRAGIVAMDTEGRIIYANHAFCAFVGLPHEEVVGMALPYPFMEPGGPGVFEQVSMAEAGEGVEARFLRSDGSLMEALVLGSPLRGSLGKSLGWMMSVNDITERKALERRIFDVGDRERRRVGHELHDGVGQILTGTALMVKALERWLEVRGDLKGAEQASRAVGNINEALTMIRSLSEGLCPIEVLTSNCAEALGELVARTRANFGVECSFTTEGDCTVEGTREATQIYLIMGEALNNAVKYSQGGRIILGLRQTSGGELVARLEDGGTGFNERDVEGRGMGMRIMRHRADLIGAQLSITSSPGGGTVVECRYKAKGDHEQ
jgi:two-component system CheB/CheR fusion protein